MMIIKKKNFICVRNKTLVCCYNAWRDRNVFYSSYSTANWQPTYCRVCLSRVGTGFPWSSSCCDLRCVCCVLGHICCVIRSVQCCLLHVCRCLWVLGLCGWGLVCSPVYCVSECGGEQFQYGSWAVIGCLSLLLPVCCALPAPFGVDRDLFGHGGIVCILLPTIRHITLNVVQCQQNKLVPLLSFLSLLKLIRQNPQLVTLVWTKKIYSPLC